MWESVLKFSEGLNDIFFFQLLFPSLSGVWVGMGTGTGSDQYGLRYGWDWLRWDGLGESGDAANCALCMHAWSLSEHG